MQSWISKTSPLNITSEKIPSLKFCWPKAMNKQTDSQACQCLVYSIHDTPNKLKTIPATSIPPQRQWYFLIYLPSCKINNVTFKFMLHLCNNSAIIRDIHSKMIYFTYYNSMPWQNQSDKHFVYSLGQKVNNVVLNYSNNINTCYPGSIISMIFKNAKSKCLAFCSLTGLTTKQSYVQLQQ